MDLIYTDTKRKDIAVLHEYELDLAFGESENDFELTLPIQNHCMNHGFFIYIENTDYGGIIDKISIDTSSEEIVYYGRTWSGVLENRTIVPDKGQKSYIVSGDANDILRILLVRLRLNDLFHVPDEESGIVVESYEFIFENGYSGICKMLSQFGGKLKFAWDQQSVRLEAVPLVDYSTVDEFDTSQMDLSISQDYAPINHMVCYGIDEQGTVYVIHLFTDNQGNLKDYASVENPYKDSHYILEQKNQMLYGIDEISAVYEVESLNGDTNYELVKDRPKDWEKTYMNYYTQEITTNEDGETSISYKNIEGITKTPDPVLQTSKPSDWNQNYSVYYEKTTASDGTVSYKNVDGVVDEATSYIRLYQQPFDWSTNWTSYFWKYTDGIGNYEWKQAESVSWTTYTLQNHKSAPSDWNWNYQSYYVQIGTQKESVNYTSSKKSSQKKQREKKKADLMKKYPDIIKSSIKFTSYRKSKKHPRGYYTVTYKRKDVYESVQAKKGGGAPAWKNNKYYTAVQHEKACSFKKTIFYKYNEVLKAPVWKNNTYYTQGEDVVYPASFGTVYRAVVDHYAKLVEGGIEKLEEAWKTDHVQIQEKNDSEDKYDVGDIIGAHENVTGIDVWQAITKKVVNMSKRTGQRIDTILSIEYEVGGNE